MCVCVCVCVRARARQQMGYSELLKSEILKAISNGRGELSVIVSVWCFNVAEANGYSAMGLSFFYHQKYTCYSIIINGYS